MGNRIGQLQKEALDEIAAHTKENGAIKKSEIRSALDDVDLLDKLSVFGYFREVALNEYDLDVPPGIINFVVLYLFFLEENEIYIGNICEVMNTTSRNRYKWTMFLSTSKTELAPPKTVKHVKYILHPTFRPPEQTVHSSPFKLARRGWGSFAVEAEITFKDKYKKEKCYAIHALDFDNWASITEVNQNDAGMAMVRKGKRKRHKFRNVKDYLEQDSNCSPRRSSN